MITLKSALASSQFISSLATKYEHTSQRPDIKLKLEEVQPREAAKIEGILKDYSLNIVSPAGRGTAWILDFELPQHNSKSYPTKWFLGTNLHVVSNFHNIDNSYTSDEDLTEHLKKSRTHEHIKSRRRSIDLYTADSDERSQKLRILREVERGRKQEWYDRPELWGAQFTRYILGNPNQEAAYEIKDAKDTTKFTEGKMGVYEAVIDRPNIIFAAVDFLEYTPQYALKDARNHYYKDFVVVEVDFESEEVAKLMTRNFYYKYYLNHKPHRIIRNLGTGKRRNRRGLSESYRETRTLNDIADILNASNRKHKPLNFFADIESQTSEEDKKYSIIPYENYFSVGYVKDAYNKYNAVGNYSPVSKKSMIPAFLGSEHKCRNLNNALKQEWMKEKTKEKLPDTNRARYKATSIGCSYELSNVYFKEGASGALVTNARGDVLGLFFGALTTDPQEFLTVNKASYGYVEPLRSNKITHQGHEISPAFDFIEGKDQQKKSYKAALIKKYPDMRTYLRELRNWGR